MKLGHKMRVHHVHCRDCKAPVALKSYFRSPKCKACRKKARKRDLAGAQRKLRQEARRYRILLAVSPYGSFEELYSALRIRNPHTRAERYDISLEERKRVYPGGRAQV